MMPSQDASTRPARPRGYTAVGTAVCGVAGLQVAMAMPAHSRVLLGVAGSAALYLLLIILWHAAGSRITLILCASIVVGEVAYWIGGGERRLALGAVLLLAGIVVAWIRMRRSI